MKGVGMLVGDQSGRGPSFFWPLKETILKHSKSHNGS